MAPKKNQGQNIVKGAMILSMSVMITKIIGILYRLPVTNALGDVGNGIYSVAYQVYIIIITLTSIGLPSAISKLVSERRAVGDYKAAHGIYKIAMVYSVGLSLVLSIVLWFGAGGASLFFQMPEAKSAIRALVPAVVIVTVMAVMKGYFQGMQSMAPTAIAQIIEQLVHAIVSIVLAYALLQFGLEAAVVGSTLGVAVGGLVGVGFLVLVYYLLRDRIHRKIRKSQHVFRESNSQILKQILVTSVPIMLSASVFSVMTTIDYGMMGSILPQTIEKLRAAGEMARLPVSSEVLHSTELISKSLTGIFSLKYMTILNLPVSLILTLGMAATPAIAASMAKGDKKDVHQKTHMIFKIGMLFAAPSALGLMVFGKEIIMFLLPKEPYGGELLAYGGIAIIFITLAQLSAGILQGMGRQQIPTIHAVIACSIKVVLNVILLSMPSVHIYGVIHSTTICYMIYAGLNIRYLLKTMGARFHWLDLVIKPVGIAIIMGVVAKGIYMLLYGIKPSVSLWLMVSIGIAVVIYGVLGIVTGTISEKDLVNIPGGHKLSAFLPKR
ncbi:MAG: putative polysaccharide biosynthesis protein [Cellulosilyticaceae bacterium]